MSTEASEIKATWLFNQKLSNKKVIAVYEGNPTVADGFPPLRASNVEGVSMSRRRHIMMRIVLMSCNCVIFEKSFAWLFDENSSGLARQCPPLAIKCTTFLVSSHFIRISKYEKRKIYSGTQPLYDSAHIEYSHSVGMNVKSYITAFVNAFWATLY